MLEAKNYDITRAPMSAAAQTLKSASPRRAFLSGTGAMLAGITAFLSAPGASAAAESLDVGLIAVCAEYRRARDVMTEFYATAPEPSWESKVAHDAWHREEVRLCTLQSRAYHQACDAPAHTLKGIFAKARVLAAENDFSLIDAPDLSQLLQDLITLEGRA
jgi:hypothetical protein